MTKPRGGLQRRPSTQRKLADDVVRQCRADRALGREGKHVSIEQLASENGVSRQAMWKLLSGVTYRELLPEGSENG